VQRPLDLVKPLVPSVDRRGLLKLFAAAGVAGVVTPALAACGSTAAPARTGFLRVGLVYPQSGPFQDIGFEMSNGFDLWLAQNGGQIGGLTVKVNNIDEGTTVAIGKGAIANALKTAEVDVLVGVANSDVMAEMPDLMTDARIPLIGSLGSPAGLKPSDFVWRTSFVNGEASKALAIYLASLAPIMSMKTQQNTLGQPKRIVTFSDKSTDANAELQAFTSQFDGTSISVNQVDDAFSAHLMDTINSLQPDLIYAAASGATAASFVSAWAAYKNFSGVPLCGPGSLTELGVAAGSARNVFTSMIYAPDLDNAANQQFTSAYYSRTNGKVPTTYAMSAYDAAQALDSAISLISGEVTSLSINAALGRVGVFDSPRGRWQFNQTRTPLQQWYLRQVRPDGRFLENAVLTDLATLT
jgi:branched-chain amino acid transport system substrate-binding protein